jgi:hypothetical protein
MLLSRKHLGMKVSLKEILSKLTIEMLFRKEIL